MRMGSSKASCCATVTVNCYKRCPVLGVTRTVMSNNRAEKYKFRRFWWLYGKVPLLGLPKPLVV